MASIKALRERHSLKRRISSLIPQFSRICYRHDLPPLPEITASWRALARGDYKASDRCVAELSTFSRQWLLTTLNGNEISIVAQLRALLKREVAGAKVLALTAVEVTDVHDKSVHDQVSRARRWRKRCITHHKAQRRNRQAHTSVSNMNVNMHEGHVEREAREFPKTSASKATTSANEGEAESEAKSEYAVMNHGRPKSSNMTGEDLKSTHVNPRSAMYTVTNVNEPGPRRTRKPEPRPAWSSSWRKEAPGVERTRSLRAKVKARLQRRCESGTSVPVPAQNSIKSNNVAGTNWCCDARGEFRVPEAAELKPLSAPLDSINHMLGEPEPVSWQACQEFCHCVRRLVILHASVLRLGVSSQAQESVVAQSEAAPALLARVCHIARAALLHGNHGAGNSNEGSGSECDAESPWTAAATALIALTAVHDIYSAVAMASPQLCGTDDGNAPEHSALVGGALLLLQPMHIRQALAAALAPTATANIFADHSAQTCILVERCQRALSRVGEKILDACAACVPVMTWMRCKSNGSDRFVLRAVIQNTTRWLRVLSKMSHIAGSTVPCAQRRRQASLASSSLALMARCLARCTKQPSCCTELDLHERRKIVTLFLRIYRALQTLCRAENVRKATAATGTATVIGALRAMAHTCSSCGCADSTAVIVFAQIHALANRKEISERQARLLISECVPPRIVKLGSFAVSEDESEAHEPAAATPDTITANDDTMQIVDSTLDRHEVYGTPILTAADSADGKAVREKGNAAEQSKICSTTSSSHGKEVDELVVMHNRISCEPAKNDNLSGPSGGDIEHQVEAVLHEIVGTIDMVGGQLGLQPWSAGSAAARASRPKPTNLSTHITKPLPGYQWQAVSRAMPAWTVPSMSKPSECADIQE